MITRQEKENGKKKRGKVKYNIFHHYIGTLTDGLDVYVDRVGMGKQLPPIERVGENPQQPDRPGKNTPGCPAVSVLTGCVLIIPFSKKRG